MNASQLIKSIVRLSDNRGPSWRRNCWSVNVGTFSDGTFYAEVHGLSGEGCPAQTEQRHPTVEDALADLRDIVKRTGKDVFDPSAA